MDGDKEQPASTAAAPVNARAKARWGILRAALLGNAPSGNGSAAAARGGMSSVSSASIHRFEGFKLLDRRVVNLDDVSMEKPLRNEKDDTRYECAEYVLPVQAGTIKIRTREKSNAATNHRVDIKALLSHRHHGVDNTGQSRVWDSESTLTHCLWNASDTLTFPLGIDNVLSLSTSKDESSDGGSKRLRVIELGAGMAGLAGLTLAALGLSKQSRCIDIDVTLTDGHPDALESNLACSILTSNVYGFADLQNISCQRLLWNDGRQGVEDCNALTNNGDDSYQLCIVSDCVHFQEFHAALATTIGRVLSVDGFCLMCQPKRANSLDRFMALLEAMNEAGDIFEVELHERYNEQLWTMSEEYLAKEKDIDCDKRIYDKNIHYPLLLILKKIAIYREDVHTTAAIKHMKSRDKKED